MGAIGRAEGEGGARVSLTNFGFRYRRASPWISPERPSANKCRYLTTLHSKYAYLTSAPATV